MKIYCKNIKRFRRYDSEHFSVNAYLFPWASPFCNRFKNAQHSTDQKKVDTIRSFIHIFPRMTEQQLCIVFQGLISSINCPRQLWLPGVTICISFYNTSLKLIFFEKSNF